MIQMIQLIVTYVVCLGYVSAGHRRSLARGGTYSDAHFRDWTLGDAGDAEPELLNTRPAIEADLGWQARAWGRQVLRAARRRLSDLTSVSPSSSGLRSVSGRASNGSAPGASA